MTMYQQRECKLGLVDDHNLFRKGLIKLIALGDLEHKYSILFEAENGRSLIEKLEPGKMPDIILLDLDMPLMDGYESVEWLNRNHPAIPVLVISMFDNDEAILRLLKLGVKGILSKDIEVEDMHLALQAIGNKGFYYSEKAIEVIKGSAGKSNGSSANDRASANEIVLSQVERDFLTLVCTDLTYQQIADKMYLSPKTIDGYRDNLFKRFKVSTRVTLAIYALTKGLVKL